MTRVGLLDEHETCQRCGGENVRWSAPSPLWNKVMRGNDINGPIQFADLVCVRCFIVLAFEAGIDGTWRVNVTPEPDGLIYETPSGRIWDAESWLWRDPQPPICGVAWSWEARYADHLHVCRHPENHPGRHVCKCRSWQPGTCVTAPVVGQNSTESGTNLTP